MLFLAPLKAKTPDMAIHTNKKILWWGRHGNYGPDYPRNRTIIKCLKEQGHEIINFQPKFSRLASLEAKLHNFKEIDLVWVPCFRQRDLLEASRWAKKHQIPLVFDPLISAYDKRVNEKQKYLSSSVRAKRLLSWEQNLFAAADILIADTESHKKYFIKQLNCQADKIHVIPVSAEETLFYPKKSTIKTTPEFLFFGTFIGLQGATHIAEAIKYYDGPPIQLSFLGDGPERNLCESICQQNTNPQINITFENWIPFHKLADRIHQADFCLGIFGLGEKSSRVIPNKVYQALACGKPVITMYSSSYPENIKNGEGIFFVSAGNPEEIAKTIKEAINSDTHLLAESAYTIYSKYFSNKSITKTLNILIDEVLIKK